MKNSYRQYFPNLDALRFFAFLAVFIAHIAHDLMNSFSGHMKLFLYSQLGNLGVNFFFVLSAFLITYLIYEERAATGYFSVTKYYIRRTLRIWPLYFFILFVGFVLIPLFKHLSGMNYSETANPWYFIFFINNVYIMYVGDPFTPVLFILWTIAIEEQFYLVWPFLTTFFSKGKEVWLFAFLIIGSLIFRYFHLNSPKEIYFHPLSIMSDFGIGGLLAYFTFKKNTPFKAFSNMGSILIAIIYLIFFTLLFFNFQIFQNPLLYIAERSIWGLFFAFIIFEQCFCKHSVLKFGLITPFNWLGKRSYGLYCFHQVGILTTINLLRYLSPFISLNLIYVEPVLALMITIALAYLSYNYFETPFLKLKNRFEF